jgi:hypothetical protein
MNRYDMMLSYIPLFYQTSGIFKAVMEVEGTEFDLLRQNSEDVKAQFFIDTATWGLQLWEKELGLATSPALSYDERRSRIKGKIRGVGKVGVELVKSVAEAYSNGTVDVAFDGEIIITFIGTRGRPSALGELQQQLDAIMPAHLAVRYAFTYLIWNEFDLLSAEMQESMTWDQLEVYKP